MILCDFMWLYVILCDFMWFYVSFYSALFAYFDENKALSGEQKKALSWATCDGVTTDRNSFSTQLCFPAPSLIFYKIYHFQLFSYLNTHDL